MAVFCDKDFYLKPSHRAMTGCLAQGKILRPQDLQDVYNRCSVSKELGALPPELRQQLGRGADVGWETIRFRAVLDSFLRGHMSELESADKDMVYDIPELSRMFGTRCVLESRGINVYGVHPWGGAVGYVCKLSFPDINAHYALKLYYKQPMLTDMSGHGPLYEIPAAFASNRSEPKDNNPVYMASLQDEMQYMLSAWAGDKVDSVSARENKYKIFQTRFDEGESRNLRAGRRIDWGETYKTAYGKLSYSGRKLYRQVMNRDMGAVAHSFANAKDGLAQRDLERAVKVVKINARKDENLPVRIFLRDMESNVR
jgi:hypothetical protein